MHLMDPTILKSVLKLDQLIPQFYFTITLCTICIHTCIHFIIKDCNKNLRHQKVIALVLRYDNIAGQFLN